MSENDEGIAHRSAVVRPEPIRANVSIPTPTIHVRDVLRMGLDALCTRIEQLLTRRLNKYSNYPPIPLFVRVGSSGDLRIPSRSLGRRRVGNSPNHNPRRRYHRA